MNASRQTAIDVSGIAMHLVLRLFFLLMLLPGIASGSNTSGLDEGCSEPLSTEETTNKLWLVNLSGIGVITAWGVLNWDYFSKPPGTTSEGWFGNDTNYGGADKLGHLYTSYVTAHGLSYLYESWCIDRDDAALYGALSSLAIVGYMEIGDSFSGFGFSSEDMLANTVGVVAGYYSYKYPSIGHYVD
ncbi:MAG TPA: DUF2279 domain-containing protein, partial [Thiotrichales bacterium]|nr:DUF2279 domain-containing protein [Thiotrichales bacterium]